MMSTLLSTRWSSRRTSRRPFLRVVRTCLARVVSRRGSAGRWEVRLTVGHARGVRRPSFAPYEPFDGASPVSGPEARMLTSLVRGINHVVSEYALGAFCRHRDFRLPMSG